MRLEDVQGWWGLNPDGCFDDEDNKERVAIGRWQRNDKGVAFGSGPVAVGFYDGGCVLLELKTSLKRIHAVGRCEQESRKFSRGVSLTLVNKFTILIDTPVWSGLLVRCGRLTRAQLQNGEGK